MSGRENNFVSGPTATMPSLTNLSQQSEAFNVRETNLPTKSICKRFMVSIYGLKPINDVIYDRPSLSSS